MKRNLKRLFVLTILFNGYSFAAQQNEDVKDFLDNAEALYDKGEYKKAIDHITSSLASLMQKTDAYDEIDIYFGLGLNYYQLSNKSEDQSTKIKYLNSAKENFELAKNVATYNNLTNLTVYNDILGLIKDIDEQLENQ